MSFQSKAQITCRDIYSWGQNLCVSKFFFKRLDHLSENHPPPNTDEWKLWIQSKCIFFTDNNVSVIRYSYFTLMYRPDTFKEIDEWINCCSQCRKWKCNTSDSTMINHNHESLSILSVLDCPRFEIHPVVNRPTDWLNHILWGASVDIVSSITCEWQIWKAKNDPPLKQL